MKLRKLIAGLLLAAMLPFAALAGSTVNPSVPPPNAPMASAPIRLNFTATYNDINNILSKFGSPNAPLGPSLFQWWMDTTVNPYPLKMWDGAQWVVVGNLNVSTHQFTTAAGSLPTPTASTLGGVKSKVPVSNQFLNSLGTDGIFTSAQPSAANLSDGTTGTGNVVLSNNPTLVTPTIGAASATSVNKVAITAPASSATLTLANGSTLATSGANSITLTSTGVTSVTLPTSGTLLNNSLTSARIFVGNGSNVATGVAMSGDCTLTNAGVITCTGTSTVIRSYLSGYGTGNNVSDTSNDLDIGAGTAADSTNSVMITMASALVKQVDASWAVGTNQGCWDTGSVSNATIHIFAIRRSDTGVVDALCSLSPTAPTMPANYDAKRRIASIYRTAGVNVGYIQNGDEFLLKVPVNAVNTTIGTTAASQTMPVPTGIKVNSNIAAVISNAAQVRVLLTPLDTTDTAPSTTVFSITASAGIATSSTLFTRTDTSAQIRARADTATTVLVITSFGWTDRRGRDD